MCLRAEIRCISSGTRILSKRFRISVTKASIIVNIRFGVIRYTLSMKNIRTRKKRNTIDKERIAVIIFIAAVFLLGAAAGIGWKSLSAKFAKKSDRIAAVNVTTEEERLEGIKQSFESGKSVLQTLRSYYPDQLVMRKNNAYKFVPVDSTLKTNNFDQDKVRKNSDGTWGYVDGDLQVIKGIDVSAHQGEIDWKKVAATNVDFAMIRAVYRGYESGKLLEDEKFRTNLEEAQANGIDTGVYIFTQAINKNEVDEEISKLNGLLGAYELQYPVVVDIEDISGSTERIEQLSKTELTELIEYYCEELKKNGYTPMLYLNIDSALNMIDLKKFEDIDKWFAVYDSDFYYPYAYKMWQYKDTGKVDGIEGNVDLNLYFPEL